MLQVSRVPGRACVVKTGGDGYRSAGPECGWKKKGDFFLLKHGQKFYPIHLLQKSLKECKVNLLQRKALFSWN
jgi:hypothetical protein